MDEEEEKRIFDSHFESLAFWEELFELEINDYHTCSCLLPGNATKIMQFTLPEKPNENTWALFNARLATFNEAENAEANRVGQVLSQSLLPISFCPFCGHKLVNQE